MSTNRPHLVRALLLPALLSAACIATPEDAEIEHTEPERLQSMATEHSHLSNAPSILEIASTSKQQYRLRDEYLFGRGAAADLRVTLNSDRDFLLHRNRLEFAGDGRQTWIGTIESRDAALSVAPSSEESAQGKHLAVFSKIGDKLVGTLRGA